MTKSAYERIRDGNKLPSPAGVALELLRLAGDERATIDAVTSVVESDPALAGRILKLVNSPLAGVPRRVASVATAVKLLGLRTIKNLALGLSLVWHHRHGSCRSFDYERFWSQSLGRAVATRELAGSLGSFSPDEAFTVGLLSKIGQLALATACPQQYARVLDRADREAVQTLLTLERLEFELDHNELSAEMLAEWRLPEVVCDAVRAQDLSGELLEQVPARTRAWAETLHLAGLVAAVLVREPVEPERLDALMSAAERLGIAADDFRPLFDTIAAAWREAGAVFSVATRDVPPLEELRAHARAARAETGGQTMQTAAQPGEPAKPEESLRILVVDDDPAALQLLARQLRDAGYEVTTAANGREALELDRATAPQMVITDWMMPEMDGLELCRRMREYDGGGFVYVIVLTASSDKTRVIEALDAGADDFLTKPYSRAELLARVRAGERIVRLEASLAERSREVARYNAQLAAASEKLRAMATTDELTGLGNRRVAFARLSEHWSLAVRHGEPLSCILIDIDHFKRFNDRFGHAVGDMVLKATADVLRRCCRAEEVACRVGGEEFMIVCPRSAAAAAHNAAERIRAAVEANTICAGEQELAVTVSAGVAQRSEQMRSPEELFKAADAALYAAKEAGRNRVCVAGPQPACQLAT